MSRAHNSARWLAVAVTCAAALAAGHLLSASPPAAVLPAVHGLAVCRELCDAWRPSHIDALVNLGRHVKG